MAQEEGKSTGRRSFRSSSRSELKSQPQYRPEFAIDAENPEKSDKLWELMAEYIDADISTIQKTIVSHVEYTLARTRFNFDISAGYKAAALSIRDRLIESWNDTQQHATASDPKRVYYLSFEFLIGRSMQNALVNLNLESRYKSALLELGFNLEDLYEEEVDPGLGNGGLGRLAACFLDSLATCDYPGWGYGIRYNYGIFRQKIIKGYQVEVPDYWLATMNPWEIERPDINYNVHFGGHVQKYYENGIERSVWMPGETVVAVAYDTPIPGYDTFNTINLRLWQSRPTNEFDFNAFNSGDYFAALEARRRAETISSVLYPNDSTQGGKELRLRQQYFFCSATIQDIFRRFNKLPRNWDELPEKVAIQLNDTHPAIAVPEMLRILVDVHGLDWQRAWNIVTRVFSYTNHTVMPEALEKWSVELMGRLLPRHLDIIYFMNHIFMEKLKQRYRGDPRLNDKMKDMSLIEEGQPKMVRMANLCVLATHAVNGVAELHTGLVKNVLFKQFNEFFPDKIRNKTNGVTPRRWIHCANTKLSALFTRTLGDYSWLKDLDRLKQLRGKENDADFREKWHKIKRKNKERLAEWVKRNCNVELNPDALFDVMVKRIHEYKRQLLNALYIIHRYLTIKDTPASQRHNIVKRVFMVGGKAAPGYIAAKKIIRLINGIADVVNNDPQIGDLMKVVFLPNYCVSSAQVIIPGADLTQQISTAGTEASGTSNMKFVMNGALIIGTMDGANVEIAQEIGQENMFIFGARVEEVERIRAEVRSGKCHAGSRLKRVFGTIRQGMFGNPHEMASIVDNLETNDFYIVCYDFYSYLDAQERVDQTYKNQEQWIKKSILGAIHMGKFSSDRTIREYAQDIWKIEPIEVPVPSESALTRVRSQPYLFDMTKSQENILQEGAERHAVVIKGLEEAHLEETLYDRYTQS